MRKIMPMHSVHASKFILPIKRENDIYEHDDGVFCHNV